MTHLLNFLAGLGSAINGLGTAPSYHIPSRSDRSRDVQCLRQDAARVGRDLTKKADEALSNEHGKVHDRAA